jgi:hypothetical protein
MRLSQMGVRGISRCDLPVRRSAFRVRRPGFEIRRSPLPKHPTSNIERPTSNDCPKRGLWMLNVGCWMLDVLAALGIAGGGPPGEERFGTLKRHGPQHSARARLPANNPEGQRNTPNTRIHAGGQALVSKPPVVAADW